MTYFFSGWVEVYHELSQWLSAINMGNILFHTKGNTTLLLNFLIQTPHSFWMSKADDITVEQDIVEIVPKDISWIVRYQIEDLGLQITSFCVVSWQEAQSQITPTATLNGKDWEILITMIKQLAQIYGDDRIRIVTWEGAPMGAEERQNATHPPLPPSID